jgi:hypothetical protein
MSDDALEGWRAIPGLVEAALSRGTLDELFEKNPMTLRELVHHVVEANVVAASIVIAGCGAPGTTYDWSWMLPFGPWMDRMAYRDKPIESALRLMHALNAYVAEQLELLPDGLGRELALRDTPGGEPRRVTIADVLRQEVEHARGHLSP